MGALELILRITGQEHILDRIAVQERRFSIYFNSVHGHGAVRDMQCHLKHLIQGDWWHRLDPNSYPSVPDWGFGTERAV